MMKQLDAIDDLRRLFLVRVLASGAFAMTPTLVPLSFAWAEIPGSLPAGRSIYRIKGDVRVNRQPASIDTLITAGDRIETGADGLVIFVVGQDAFLLRSNSSLQLAPETASGGEAGALERAAVALMRLATGKVLSVFGKSDHTIVTPVATIGIRGTGIYVESAPDESYVCTCYGTADITAAGDPAAVETVISTHHSAPRYVTARGESGTRIHAAPFKNHDDDELLLIESLVGRTTPFLVPARRRSRRRRY